MCIYVYIWPINSLFRVSAVRHLGFLKVKFLTVVHFRDTFYSIVPNFVEVGQNIAEIAEFLRNAFSSQICNNLLDDRTLYGITLSQLELIEYTFVILHRYECAIIV